MNDLFCLMFIFPFLAQSFLRPQGFLMNYDLFPFLARSFFRIQGLGLLFFTNNKLYFDLKISEFSVTSVAKKISKTKPKQTQNKAKQSQFFGGFWRKNFNFSLKIDDTKLNFLCKTKPIQIYLMNITKSLYPLCPLWLNCKTNPKRTQTNPIFWRSNPILSPKMRIFDKFRTTFLCKTNPILLFKNLIFYT